jgi:4'-phosphopantetheinyl transferase
MIRQAAAPIDRSMESLVPLLAVSEQRRLVAMSDQCRALARAHAYVLLRSLLGLPAATAPVEYDTSGAPRMASQSLHISISHTSERVLVALCDEGPVGVDIADLREVVNTAGFLHYATAASERPLLGALTSSGWSLRSALTIFWSMKEAVFKCTGADFVPKDARVRSIGGGQAVVLHDSTSYRCAYRFDRMHVETVAVAQ